MVLVSSIHVVFMVLIPLIVGVVAGRQMHRDDVRREVMRRSFGSARDLRDFSRDDLTGLLQYATGWKKR